MGTRNKGKSFRPFSKAAQKEPQAPQSQSPAQYQQPQAGAASSAGAQAAQATAQASSPGPATIRKGVYLSALIYVEGDQAPADDFNSLTISTLKKGLGDYFATPHDGLTMTLKSVNVQNNAEDGSDSGDSGDSGDKKSGGKQEEKFQF